MALPALRNIPFLILKKFGRLVQQLEASTFYLHEIERTWHSTSLETWRIIQCILNQFGPLIRKEITAVDAMQHCNIFQAPLEGCTCRMWREQNFNRYLAVVSALEQHRPQLSRCQVAELLQ